MTIKRKFTCTRHMLRPGSREAVAEWAAESNRRSAEVLKGLEAEGVRLEAVLLEESDEGDSLIFILDTDDYDRAVEVYMQSTDDFDNYHRKFLAENVVSRRRLTTLVVHELPTTD
jgi:hypothetical protein